MAELQKKNCFVGRSFVSEEVLKSFVLEFCCWRELCWRGILLEESFVLEEFAAD